MNSARAGGLGQAVDDDALRFEILHGFDDPLDRLAKLKIRRIQQTLMLLGIEHAPGSSSSTIATLSSISQPCERAPARNFVLGLGQTDVDTDLAGLGTRHQELQRNRGLAGSRTTLQQVQPVAGKTAASGCRRDREFRSRRGEGFLEMSACGWYQGSIIRNNGTISMSRRLRPRALRYQVTLM